MPIRTCRPLTQRSARRNRRWPRNAVPGYRKRICMWMPAATRLVVPAPDAGIDTPYALRTAQLSVSYTLDVFGGTRRQVEAADAQAQAQRDQRDAAYLSLTANVVNAAIGEASVRAQLDAARAQVAIAEQLCTLTERQQALGAVGAAQVLAQRTALAQAQAAVPGWKNCWNSNGPCSRFWAGACPATLRVRH